MASRSEVQRTRAHLGIAAKTMKDTHPEVAETLEALRKPYGARLLMEDRNAPRVPSGTRNVTLMVPEHLRQALQEAALDSVDSDDAKATHILGAVLSAKIPQVLAGDLDVREIPRDPRGMSTAKVGLNVPVDNQVVEELRGQLFELGERLGFESKASVMKVALRILLDEYGMEYEPAALPELAQVQMHVPPRLAAAIRERLTETGSDLRSLVEEGYTKVLSGSWQPYKIPKAAQGSEYERDRMPFRASRTLVESVRAKCPELKETLGHRVTPPSIALDYLIAEFGLEDLADAEFGSGQ
ncbi:hypothetical protein AB0900_31085 [Streptomyces cellulosae]